MLEATIFQRSVTILKPPLQPFQSMAVAGRSAPIAVRGTSAGLLIDFCLLGYFQRIIHLDAKITHRTFKLGMLKQQLDGSQVLGAPLDQCCFCSPHSYGYRRTLHPKQLNAPKKRRCVRTAEWTDAATSQLFLETGRRARTFALVKFWSRLLIALNLLPSMAMNCCVNRSRFRHSSTNCRQTLRMPTPLSLRKLAIILKSGVSRPVSHINSMLRWASRSRRQLD